MNQLDSQVFVLNHPLIQHKLTQLRNESTPTGRFRDLLKEISLLMAYEVTKDFPLVSKKVKTPFVETSSFVIEEEHIIFISILRAGNGLLNGMMELFPDSKIGHVGLYRDPKTLVPVEYYLKLPKKIEGHDLIVLDPMLATGNSAIAAVSRLKEFYPRTIKFVNVIACQEGIDNFKQEHPDVKIYTTAIDPTLNEKGYVLPGFGDAGDRIYGTK